MSGTKNLLLQAVWDTKDRVAADDRRARLLEMREEQHESGRVRITAILRALQISRATLYRLIGDEGFPKKACLSGRRGLWNKAEIVQWFDRWLPAGTEPTNNNASWSVAAAFGFGWAYEDRPDSGSPEWRKAFVATLLRETEREARASDNPAETFNRELQRLHDLFAERVGQSLLLKGAKILDRLRAEGRSSGMQRQTGANTSVGD